MKFRLLVASVTFLSVVSVAGTGLAASCFDLWYERNAIYADRGYCFSTRLAREHFDTGDCWTRSPKFTRAEQRRIEALRAEERRRGCKVN